MTSFTQEWLRLDRRRNEYGLLAAVILLGLVLRFFRLGEWSFWIDELYTIGRAQAHVNLAGVLSLWWRPALSVWLTGGVLSLAGVSETSARLVPALIGIVSIPALYFPIRRIWGRETALTAVLLLAIAPWHLFWSQNARFYTALMLLYALASFALYFALEDDRPGYVVAFYALLWLAVGERFFALFLIPVAVAYLLLLKFLPFEKPAGLRLRMVALIVSPILVVIVADLVRLLAFDYSYFLASLELAYADSIDDPFRLGLFIANDVGYPLVALGFCGGLYSVAGRSRAGLFALLGAIVPIGLLLVLNPIVFTKARYAFVTLPSWVILGGIAIKALIDRTRGRERWLAAGVLAALLLDGGAANLLYYTVNNGNRLDWRGAWAIVQEGKQPGDRFVAWWPEFGDYYLGEAIIQWKEVTPAVVEQTGGRYWFVLDSETRWENVQMKAWVERSAKLIDWQYLRTVEENSLYVYLYDPHLMAASQ